ncbi:MAG: choice-of-anchor D domain-containing protein [Bacteroidetes bacterium]|nr:choice-of-anchor D domain-containing protein [Bacteroidota bacterium]
MKKLLHLFTKNMVAACLMAGFLFATNSGFTQTGEALHFDGTDDYASFSTSGMTATAGTISFWMNAEASQPNNASMLTEIGSENTAIFLWSNGSSIYFRAGGVGSQSAALSFTGGSWKHVAMTWAGVGQEAKCYIDGVQVATFTQSGAASFGSAGYLGRSSLYANGTTNLLGSMDDIRFWNRTLCADEISQLKDCEVSATSDNLQVYFKCNQGTAGGDNTGITALTDDATLIGGANDATLFNFALNGATSNFVAPGGITGGACSPSLPEINLQGNGQSIADGDNTPSTADHTDFGSVAVNSSFQRTFTIQNTGTSNLTVSTITVTGTNSSEFVVSGISLPATIGGSGSTTFIATFTPTASGTRSAVIHVNNNDCDEADYNFAVQGTGFTNYNFNGTTNSDWATASNWSTGTVPTSLASGDAVVIAANCTMNDVTISFPSGTSLTVNSGKALSPSLNTFITINSGATLTVQASGSISQGRITNAGTMDISGSYTAFYMTNNSGGMLNILSGGSYSCPACAETFNVGGTINNSGTMHAGTGSTWQGTVNNNAGGTITDGGNGAQIQLGASSTLNNYGSFVSRTAGTSGIFNNYSTGSLTMPGTCNFTVKNGSTFTNDGTVTVGNSDNFFNVNSGGTATNNATFNGIGTLTQSGTFTNSATAAVNPGNSPGKLTVTGSLDLGSATYNCEINGTVQGTNYDHLAISGTATIGASSKIHFIFGYAAANGATFDVLTAGTVSGTFSGGNITFANTGAGNVTGVSVTYPGGNTVRVTVTSPLPVELVSFTGREMENGVLLEWQTASELNNEGFHVERMTGDGGRWTEIGFVAGRGTTSETHDYSFLDEKPLPGTNYYRLRQTDFDGGEELSKVVSVDFRNLQDFGNLRVFPNPASSGELTLFLSENSEETTTVRLFSPAGQLVHTASCGSGTQTLDVSDLAEGIYTLQAWNGTGRFLEKIVLLH